MHGIITGGPNVDLELCWIKNVALIKITTIGIPKKTGERPLGSHSTQRTTDNKVILRAGETVFGKSTSIIYPISKFHPWKYIYKQGHAH